MMLLAVAGAALLSAGPAHAAEAGITEVSSAECDDALNSCRFTRTLVNGTEQPIEAAPRDLSDAGYRSLTLLAITHGSFSNGIWTVGTIAPGGSASIEYSATAPAPPTGEALPATGSDGHLAALAVGALLLMGLGIRLVHSATR